MFNTSFGKETPPVSHPNKLCFRVVFKMFYKKTELQHWPAEPAGECLQALRRNLAVTLELTDVQPLRGTAGARSPGNTRGTGANNSLYLNPEMNNVFSQSKLHDLLAPHSLCNKQRSAHLPTMWSLWRNTSKGDIFNQRFSFRDCLTTQWFTIEINIAKICGNIWLPASQGFNTIHIY